MNANELLPHTQPTAREVRAGQLLTLAVAEAIREAGEIPSGTLYAMLLGRIDIHGYTKMLAILKSSGLVAETNHLLRWTGPFTGAK